jgi:hypothetical protein
MLFLSKIIDKNSKGFMLAMAMVYSIVLTPTTFVAYVGSIGSNAEIEAPCIILLILN